ncbi:MAG: AbrB/MazE/SpoVT family DNA-binding domain-containing protein [Spirochaetaceae bacterium]
MLVSVIPIGNSKGIRIPKKILQQLHIEDSVELEVHKDELLIKPIHKNAREGWAKSFSQMSYHIDDELFISDDLDIEESDWVW